MKTRKRQAWGLPWFRTHDGWWYVTIRGKKIKLVKGEDKKEDAMKEWHKQSALAEAERLQESNPLWVIFNRYLEYTEKKHPGCLMQYQRYCQSFKDKYPSLRVKDLRANHVNAWIEEHTTWSDSTRYFAISVILSALNWAAKPEEGLIDRNPLRGMSRPAIHSRGAEAILDADEFEAIYKHAQPWVKDALLFLRQTGTRPSNLARIEAKSLDIANKCVRLKIHKTAKKTGRPLVIPLTQPALDLLVRLAELHPAGPLFRGQRGNPLTGRRLTACFNYIKKKLNLKGNPILYGIRHTVATELLSKDMSDAKVAFVLGHTSTAMIYRHYGHLDSTSRSISDELERKLNEGISSQANSQTDSPK